MREEYVAEAGLEPEKMQITAVEPRKKGMSVLYFEDGSSLRLLTEIVLLEKLKAGIMLSLERAEELERASNLRKAEEKALRLLDFRAYSRKELEDRLARDTDREAARDTALRMEELGLIDDEEYAGRLAAELAARKGFSESRIRQELCRRGLDRDLAAQAAETAAPDPQEALRALVERKYLPSLRDERGKRRTVAALQRLGYRFEEIRVVLRDFSEYIDTEDEENENGIFRWND